MKSFLVAAIGMLSIGGCAFFSPDEAQPMKPVIAPVGQVKPKPKREFGSLWSEDSIWNDVYSSSAARSVGDIVIVKLDTAMKSQILQRYDQLVPPVEDEAKEDSEDMDAAAKAKALQVAQQKAKENQSQKIVRATIEEVRPRGMYRIAGTEVVRFGDRQPRVSIEGTVRDRDIDSADSVASELLLEPQLEVATAKSSPAKDTMQAQSSGG